MSSALFVLCGALVAVAAPTLPLNPGESVAAVEGVAALALVGGIVIALVPWERWGRTATLWLMPVALGVVALHNLATNADGFRYSLFFMVTFVWLGLGHRRGMSIRFAPLLAVAYVVPLAVVGASTAAFASTAYAVPACVLTGETVAYVSDRVRRSEARLRSSERRFRSLVEHAADVITVVDADGTITYESPPIADVLGCGPEGLVGTKASARIHPDDRAALSVQLAHLRSHPGSIAGLELRLRHTDGSWRWCALVIRNLLADPSVAGFIVNFHDVSDQHRAALALADSEASFRTLFAANPRPMLVYDLESFSFLEVSDAAVRQYGYRREEFLTMRITDITNEEDVAVFVDSVDGQPALPHTSHERHRLRDGRDIDVEVTSHRLTFAGRDAVLVDVHDVTDRNVLEGQLRHQAFHDPLTGLANRPLFTDRVEHALAVRRSEGRGIALLLLDLDQFKAINDSLGHAVGDELLVGVAERLVRCLRPGDTAARLGGDEFVVLLEDVGHLNEATEVAARIVESLRAPFILAGRDVGVRTSVGVVWHHDGVTTADELVRNADAAMYAAKSAGTGSWRVFEASMHDAVLARLELEGQLRGAIDRDELVLHYQPIVTLATGDALGYESLLRWQHAERGLLPPDAFLAIAEDTGMILPIGHWVLAQSCAAAARWPLGADGRALGLSVNVSARQLFDPELVGTVAAILSATGLEPSRLTLEITESVLLEDVALAVRQLRALRALGVRLAIDDFGTGYSSLSDLRSYPVDALKIDKSFTDSVHLDIEGACFVQAILHLANVMKVRTVAEGVEHEAQAVRLRELGCDEAQGFHFGRPHPSPLAGADRNLAMSDSSPQAIPPFGRSLVGAREWGTGR